MPHTWWNFEIDFSLDNHQTSSGYESEYVIRVLRFLQNKQTKTPPQSLTSNDPPQLDSKNVKIGGSKQKAAGCKQLHSYLMNTGRGCKFSIHSFHHHGYTFNFFWPTFNCHEMIIWNLGVHLELFATLVLFWLLWYTWNSNDLFVVWEASTFHCIGLIFEKYGSACSF